MKSKNMYFATVFTQLLDEWKKKNNATQDDFAACTGIHKNSITNYKKGESYPMDSALKEICKVLEVKESVFYPKSFEEKLLYDDEFRKNTYLEIADYELDVIKEYGIDLGFYSYLTHIDFFPDLFSFEKPPTEGIQMGLLTWFKDRNGKNVGLTENDLLHIKNLQIEATKILHLILIREAMYANNKRKDGE